MAHNANRTTAWLLATLMMIFGDVAMAISLKLADPSELAGQWQATQVLQGTASNECTLELQPNQTLGNGADCLSDWLGGETAIGWFPEPDGIAITGKDGAKILFFSRQSEGTYKATMKSANAITLVRQAH